jgi:hypothetical protein
MKEHFAIFGKRKINPLQYKLLGNGFFISNFGLFISAGHVFNNHLSDTLEFLIGSPEDSESFELIKIKQYYFASKKLYLDDERNNNTERVRKYFQCGPEYTDFAVGIVEIRNTPYYKLKRKRPFEWENLNMPCYNINISRCPNRVFELDNTVCRSTNITFNQPILRIEDRLKHARMPFLYENMVFENIDKYNNCMEVCGEGERGNSGAPILDDNGNVIGIFVAGTTFNDLKAVHLSRYIIKRSKHFIKKLRKISQEN